MKRIKDMQTLPKNTVAVLGTLGATACVLTSATPAARAQGILPVRVKLGVLLPSDGETKKATGDTHIAAEVDVALPSALTMGSYVASIGYAQSTRSGAKLTTVPITVSRIFSPPNPATRLTGNVYFGVGAGMYILHASGGGRSDNETTFGGFGVVGYSLPGGATFIEAKYHVVAKDAGGLKPTGLAVLVGRRF